MSDTPKTDELAKREFVPDGVWIRHARDLERENATLRSLADDMAAEMEQHGGEMAFDSLARYRAALGKEAKP